MSGADEPMLLGVDIGTTRIKAVVVDPEGVEHHVSDEPTPWTIDGPRVEIDPRLLAERAKRVITLAVNTLRAGRPGATIVGVGVTGMAEAGVLIDAAGDPLTDIIAWYDPRGATDRVAAELPDFSRITGMALDPVASIMKLPILLERAGPAARHWLGVPEWIVFALGGEPFSEISLASRTGLYDVRSRKRWDDAFAFLGMPETLVPTDPAPGMLGAGTATFEPVAGARLVVAGHDHQVAAYGEGAIGPASLFDSLGTAEALVRTTDTCPTEAVMGELTDLNYSVGATVVDGLWVALAGFRSGQMLERISSLLGLHNRQARRAVAEAAIDVTPHPGLTVHRNGGEMVISGITDGVTPAQLWRAVVDASDAHTCSALELFDRHFGPTENVTIAGGWLNDVAVAAAKQRRFGSFHRAVAAEAGAVGAALMAGVSAGTNERPEPGGRQ